VLDLAEKQRSAAGNGVAFRDTARSRKASAENESHGPMAKDTGRQGTIQMINRRPCGQLLDEWLRG
jgi:hypothetical protein